MLFPSSLLGLLGLVTTISASPIAAPVGVREVGINGTYKTGGLECWAGPYDDTLTKRDNPI